VLAGDQETLWHRVVDVMRHLSFDPMIKNGEFVFILSIVKVTTQLSTDTSFCIVAKVKLKMPVQIFCSMVRGFHS